MRILITGAKGQLGRTLKKTNPKMIINKKISLILAPGSFIHAGSDLILTDDVTTALDVRLSKKSESNN